MSDVLPELIELPANDLPIEAIDEILREKYGLSGQIFPIEGRQNPYFLIDNGHLRYLLKVSPADAPGDDVEAEHALMRHILRSPDGPRIPEPVVTRDGAETINVPLGGEDKLIRLLTFIDGSSPPINEPMADDAIAALGAISASLAKSLEDFQHPILAREPAGDLRKAGPQTVSLLSAVADQEVRDVIAKVMVTALRRIQPLAPGLRISASHQNLDADALVGETGEDGWLPSGVTDFSGIATGWPVAGFAVTLAWLLASRGGDPFSILPAVHTYHDIHPLTLPELEALWPLVLARTGILAAAAEKERAQSPDDPSAIQIAEMRRSVLDRASATSPARVFAAILDATGMSKPLPEIGRLLPDIDPDTIRPVDLSVTSPLLYGGNWLDPENDWKLLARIAWETGRACTRYGEYRLSKSVSDPLKEPESFSLHIDACIPAGSAAVAPFAGKLHYVEGRLALTGQDLTLLIEGLESTLEEDAELSAGDTLGRVAGAEGAVGGLRLQFCRDPDLVPPLFCTPSTAGTWRHLCPSPSALLGIDADMARPDRPAHPIRGWREYLYDVTGRSSLDFSGNAPLIGHGHPRLAAAIYRQSLLLDRDTGYLSEAEENLRSCLAELSPEGLDHVAILSSRRRALEHALALVRAKTGRRRIIALTDNGIERPDQDYFRVPSPATATEMVQDLDDVAAILMEGFGETDGLGNLIEALHRKSGLAIVMENGTGYGRLGQSSWGASHRGIRPDVLVADSPDGSPLTFVMTRAETAVSLPPRTRTAIPPVLVTAALVTLDLIAEENLHDNAREIGGYMKTRLEELAARFEQLTAVSGSGLLIDLDLPGAAKHVAERLRPAILVNVVGPDRLTLRPPLCLSREGADLFLARLENALSET